MPLFNNYNKYAILILALVLAVQSTTRARTNLVTPADCIITGCKICFTPENCLLCDVAKGYNPEPLENSCLC